jgi:FkbM family methyltransferase
MNSRLADLAQAALRMGQLAVVRREPALVWRDGRVGGWVHRYRHGVLVSPRPRGRPWKVAQQNTRDIFYYGYQPAPGDVVVELGAEYGTETVTLSRAVGPAGRVIAVEAHPWTCELLRATVAANALTNVTVVNAAVVGTAGPVRLSDGGRSTLSNSVLLPGPGVEVPGCTLDGLVESMRLTRIDLLKVNIEGAELAALAGMESAIGLVRHAVISCHDFVADRGMGEEFRTSSGVDAALARWGFTVTTRPDDPRPWVPHYRYASRVGGIQ